MPTNYGILYDKDRRVRVYNAGTPVVASNLQSVYAKYLNFIGNRFTTAANGDKYDISLTYPDKVIPYEGGTAQGSTPGYLNFNDSHFDVSALTGDKYDITSTGWVKVNALTVKPLNISNATNHEAVTITENANDIGLVYRNDEVDVFSNGSLITTKPRRINFDTSFTVTEDDTADTATIALAGGGSGSAPVFLPTPMSKKYGLAIGGLRDLNSTFGDGLFNQPHNYTDGTVTGGVSSTHGHFRRYVLNGEDNDLLGFDTDFPMTQLGLNPHLYGKISLAVLDDSRFFMGWNSDEIITGENTYLDDRSGYGLGYQYDTAETEDTVWYNILNDGDAAENKIATAINLTDTTPFTFELVGDIANNRWGFNINGGAFTYRAKGTAADTPDTTTNLRFTFRMEEIGSEPTTLDLYYLFWTQDM